MFIERGMVRGAYTTPVPNVIGPGLFHNHTALRIGLLTVVMDLL